MKINWMVRIKNKAWWLAIIPAIALLVQAVLQAFDISWDYATLVGKLAAIVEAAFAVLVLMGVIIDPTTNGFADSFRAMTYSRPAANIKEDEDVLDPDLKVGCTD